jgi:hypothetical protein
MTIYYGFFFSLSFTSLMLPECLFSYQCQAEEKGQLDGLGGHKSCEQIPKSLTRFCFIEVKGLMN